MTAPDRGSVVNNNLSGSCVKPIAGTTICLRVSERGPEGTAYLSAACKTALPETREGGYHAYQTLISGPLMDLTTGSPRVSTLESLIRCLGQTVAHMPQLSHLL